MKLDSFRELLTKKTDDYNVQFLIKNMKDDVLCKVVHESLQKMASRGSAANGAVRNVAGKMTGTHVDMLHDALSHHVTRYVAARKAGDHKTADKHLERSMHLMDFSAKADPHSRGKIKFEHVLPTGWEVNYAPDRNPNGKYQNNQEGTGRRLFQGVDSKFKDYRYLELAPHDGYGRKGNLKGHSGAYPFEDMKVNGKHTHIDHEHENTGEYEEHHFDSHPLFSSPEGKKKPIWEHSIDQLDKLTTKNPGAMKKYSEDLKKWNSTVPPKWEDEHFNKIDADPEYENRGSTKSEGFGTVKGDLKSSHEIPQENRTTMDLGFDSPSKKTTKKPKKVNGEYDTSGYSKEEMNDLDELSNLKVSDKLKDSAIKHYHEKRPNKKRGS